MRGNVHGVGSFQFNSGHRRFQNRASRSRNRPIPNRRWGRATWSGPARMHDFGGLARSRASPWLPLTLPQKFIQFWPRPSHWICRFWTWSVRYRTD